MDKNNFKIWEYFSKKNLTKISLFFNLVTGKVLRVNTPIPSLFWEAIIQLENKGQNFE